MNLIDTHFHLDLTEVPEKMVDLIEGLKIYTIAVTNAPSVFHYTYQILKDKKYIRPALGLHPQLIIERQNEIKLFKRLVSETRYIGEVGLDYSNLTNLEKALQKKLFHEILDVCAGTMDKILTVHSRGTAGDVISAIGRKYPGKIILHWYSGSLSEMEKAIEYGYYFSVNSSMVKSEKGRRIILSIPDDQLLTESDGPFIKEKKKPVDPLIIPDIITSVAKLKGSNRELLNEKIYRNFKNMLLL